MYNLNILPANIANYSIKKYEGLISKTKYYIENKTKDFDDKHDNVRKEFEASIQNVNNSLEKAKTYKFIELNQGFDKILQDKKQSLDILITLLIIFGGICTSILCYKINYILTNQINLFEHKTISLFISSFALFFQNSFK
ncbi:MAG: hypothetical protein RLZZ210_957 [Pseudomonadota bacterium]|jgi:hypothetical protein